MLVNSFHPLHTQVAPPERLNNPFDYEPHPLCLVAAAEVRTYLANQPQWADELAAGKMLGVLVCRSADGQLGFLAAYSGQLGGREDWPWFVPAVFDYLQPDGYFRQEEQAISELNHRVKALETAPDYQQLQAEAQQIAIDGERAVADYKTLMQLSKERRDEQRRAALLDDETEAALIRESQYQKAELRRLKTHWREAREAAEARMYPVADAVATLRRERRERSDQLQHWLFDHFVMTNATLERRTLTDIFKPTTQGVPPSGAGECCAPKLLQYAFLNHLTPLAIAEFWHGRSPRMEVRHDGQYYPACQGKCKPILEWMLQTKPQPLPGGMGTGSLPHPSIIKEDEAFVVISKPAGLLSVPGKSELPSVESMLSERYGRVWMVHRLDMDTSGLMVVALTVEAYHELQQQFLHRTVEKRYIALLDGMLTDRPPQGTIDLPLRPDLDDRPRQLVDYVHGREATTDYRVLTVVEGHTLVELTPHTGRTHQLRVHCAHEQGLGLPIVGDRLYGQSSTRLCLHAAQLSFNHPLTGERLTFTDERSTFL